MVRPRVARVGWTEEMLAAAGCPDEALVRELANGFALVGEMPRSGERACHGGDSVVLRVRAEGNGPAVEASLDLTPDELWWGARRWNGDVQRRVCQTGVRDQEVARENPPGGGTI